jgi:hypothetical protein
MAALRCRSASLTHALPFITFIALRSQRTPVLVVAEVMFVCHHAARFGQRAASNSPAHAIGEGLLGLIVPRARQETDVSQTRHSIERIGQRAIILF